ncbi:hypothetical protein FHS43_003114 [Streptosporangium becharense]|uniref:DUF3071 domain-containing protein n=1 Tax=Streptosporangium becharense TaxID=1816182 RepID=A0A7W9MJ67_9ACTN|nr:septation protein SepH [Streptosporangium becharense]MBB2911841.1 hypothetical protein [Streptosporangium becharense]MBB5822341.1 hypothetical protein [Streptosporangium becharense]
MQELRLVAVSEDGTYLVLATAGRGTRFTLPVDDRLRAAVRGNFSRLGQYEIEVESPLRPKEIQARIRAGETAEEIANTAGIPVERVRWFEGPVLQEREYMAQQAQRCAVRLPGDSSPGPTLGDLVAERLTRRGVPADEIEWDSAKRDDNMWRIKLGFVWNGHARRAEWLFDPRRRHITPHDDEALRLSSGDEAEPAEDTTVTPFVPRVAKLAPVPPLAPEPLHQAPISFPSVVRQEPPAPARPAYSQAEPPAAYRQPPMPPLPPGYEAPRVTVPPLRAPDPAGYEPDRAAEPAVNGSGPPVWTPAAEPALPSVELEPAPPPESTAEAGTETTESGTAEPETTEAEAVSEPETAEPGVATAEAAVPEGAAEPPLAAAGSEPAPPPETTAEPGTETTESGTAEPETTEAEAVSEPETAEPGIAAAEAAVPEPAEVPEPVPSPGEATAAAAGPEPVAGAEETPAPEPVTDTGPAKEPIAVPAARVSVDEQAPAEPVRKEGDTGAMQETKLEKPPVPEKPAEPPKPAPVPARPAKKSRGRRASVPTWDEIMFGARRPD